MSALSILKKSVEKSVNEMTESVLQVPIEDAEVYGNWLAQTYYFVCHSTRLLALTSSRFPLDQNDYHYRYAEHIKEERGHEILALNDLKKMKLKIENFPELTETKAFYQTQYYQIEHVSPMAFWGYVFCLEVFAISGGVNLYQRVCEAHGKSAGIFLNVHVNEDEGHVDEAYEILKDLKDQDLKVIEENLKLSCDLYAGIYKRIKSVHELKSGLKAA